MTLHQTMIVRLGDLSGAHAPLVVYRFGSDSATLRAQDRAAGAGTLCRMARQSPAVGPGPADRFPCMKGQ